MVSLLSTSRVIVLPVRVYQKMVGRAEISHVAKGNTIGRNGSSPLQRSAYHLGVEGRDEVCFPSEYCSPKECVHPPAAFRPDVERSSEGVRP